LARKRGGGEKTLTTRRGRGGESWFSPCTCFQGGKKRGEGRERKADILYSSLATENRPFLCQGLEREKGKKKKRTSSRFSKIPITTGKKKATTPVQGFIDRRTEKKKIM